MANRTERQLMWIAAGLGTVVMVIIAGAIVYKVFSGEGPDENDLEALKNAAPNADVPPVAESATKSVIHQPDAPTEAAPAKTVPEAPVLTETQKAMVTDLKLDGHADHVKVIEGKTYIVNDSGEKIAEIKKIGDVDSGEWGKKNVSELKGRNYIIATLGDDKPFGDTLSDLKKIGIDRTGDVIAYTDHVSDNGQTDVVKNRCGDIIADHELRQNNQLIKVAYANCAGEPVIEPPKVVVKPEPVVTPVEPPAVQEICADDKVDMPPSKGGDSDRYNASIDWLRMYEDRDHSGHFSEGDRLIADMKNHADAQKHLDTLKSTNPEMVPSWAKQHPDGTWYDERWIETARALRR